jgi:hypothetical protein
MVDMIGTSYSTEERFGSTNVKRHRFNFPESCEESAIAVMMDAGFNATLRINKSPDQVSAQKP